MKERFLKELNRELISLKRKERKKCLLNYEEIILDKMESGIGEEEAVAGLGTAKQIAQDVLHSYMEPTGNAMGRYKYFINFNKVYVIADILMAAAAFLLAYYVRFREYFSYITPVHLPFGTYMSYLLYVIPCYLILCYVFKLYTVRYACRGIGQIANILKVNAAGILFFALGLYVTAELNFSRYFILLFAGFNTLFQIAVRSIIHYGAGILSVIAYKSMDKCMNKKNS